MSALISQAQWMLTTIGEGGNKKAAVSEHIGLANITINYDRPGVKGRDPQIKNTFRGCEKNSNNELI